MAWRVELAASAAKQLQKLDPQIATRILTFLRDRVSTLDDPRSIGEALRGKDFGDFWKYRVGDWRMIARVRDERLIIYIVRVGHRREVYR